jgi:hypothetical protein
MLYNKIQYTFSSMREFDMKVFTSLLTMLGLAVVIILLFTHSGQSSEIPSISEDEPFSTLVCDGEQAVETLTGIRDAYNTDGDAGAFKAANVAIADGICEYSDAAHHFWNEGWAPAEQKQFEEVNDCVTMRSGQCIAVQPIFTVDDEGEIDWTGYMLILPEIADPAAWPTETEAMRLQKGLIHNSNY